MCGCCHHQEHFGNIGQGSIRTLGTLALLSPDAFKNALQPGVTPRGIAEAKPRIDEAKPRITKAIDPNGQIEGLKREEVENRDVERVDVQQRGLSGDVEEKLCILPDVLPEGYERISTGYDESGFVLKKDSFDVNEAMFKCKEGYVGTVVVSPCEQANEDVVFKGCAKEEESVPKETTSSRATSASVLLNGVMDFLGSLESSDSSSMCEFPAEKRLKDRTMMSKSSHWITCRHDHAKMMYESNTKKFLIRDTEFIIAHCT